MIPRKELLLLYQNTLKGISTADVWPEFLQTACFNYKFDFDDQVLIYAQKRAATVLLSEEQWRDKYQRKIKSNQAGISLFAPPESPAQTNLVYDISDTQEDKSSTNVPVFRFENTEEYRAGVIKALNSSYGMNETDFEKAVYSAALRLTQDELDNAFPELLKSLQDSPARNYSAPLLRKKAEMLIADSAAYMCLYRCGIPTANKTFRGVSLFRNEAVIILGTVMNGTAANVMKTVFRAALKITNKSHQNRQQTVAIKKEKSYTKSVEKDNTYDERMRQYVSEFLRPEETGISQKVQTTIIHADENNRSTERAPTGITGTGLERVGRENRQESGSLGTVGRTQGERHDEMGRAVHKSSGDHTDADSRGDDLYLKSNKQNFGAELLNTLPSFLSQEEIDNFLIRGSLIHNGKYRIFEQFDKKETSKENASFLKKEYGIGGYFGSNKIGIAYNGKGITFSDSDFKKEYKLTWTSAAKRIDQLIEANRYFTPAELKAYAAYKAEKDTAELHKAFQSSQADVQTDHNQLQTKHQYTYQLGDTAYIGTKEFEIVAVSPDILLSDISFPLYQEHYSTEIFEEKLEENPLNDHLKVTEQKVVEEQEIHFDSIEFEKLVPHHMRFKETSLVNGNEMYWITQGIFNGNDLREFQQAIKKYDGNIKKFYVTPRDLSPSYSFEEDLEQKVLAIITPDTILKDDYIQAVRNEGLGDYLQPEEKADPAEAPTFDIGMGYLGNGLTVWNRAVEENGDYQTIAHISDEGEIRYYVDDLPDDVVARIEQAARREQQKALFATSYQVGDRVYLDGKPFEITRVDDWNVELMDRSVQNPQPRLERKDSFMRLIQQNERSSFTNTYRAYSEIKKNNPDSLVLYQMGDFFEAYDADAQIVSEALELNLASRSIGGNQRTEMCGFPANRLETHINMLLDRGFDVTVSSLENGERSTRNIVSTNKEDPVQSQPVGRIDYLHTDGTVRESIEYTSPYQLEKDIKEENFYSVPFTLVLYKDKDGNTIPQDFVSQLDPPLQGLRIIDSPYLANSRADEMLTQAKQEAPAPEQPGETALAPSFTRPKRSRAQPFDLHPKNPMSERHNFDLASHEIPEVGKKERFRRNIAAIHVLKECEFENRFATPEEQEILSQYVGWGGLADCFDNRHAGYQELKSLLTDAEYEAARASTLTAFYTPPAVIESIYRALTNMGFHTGNLLDPACGTGHFIGMLPKEMKKSKVYGVEIDSLSGRIAKQLYPEASIAVEGFEKTTLPDSFFDVMVGNVPFGNFRVNDSRYAQQKFLIHDFFFAKALDKVRPGGVIAFITSKGTLDKSNPSVRKYIAQRAELIGAIRLPDNTFKGAAGTEVTSDILFLQKRDKMIEAEPNWLYLDTDNNGITINRYFIDHPEMILGKMVMENGRFGYDSVCKADETTSLIEQLEKAITFLNAKVETKEVEELPREAQSILPADPNVRPFSYTIVDGQVYYRDNSFMERCTLPAKTQERIKGMIPIRDSLRRLLNYQTEDYPEADIKTEQAKLNDLYDQFAKKYGVLTSRTNKSAFREDSSAPLVCALEVLDNDGKCRGKADIFTKRTINANRKITHADTAADALAASLSERACVDLNYMAQLMGGSEHIKEIVLNLKDVIFKDPTTGPFDFNGDWLSGWQTADEYLSGNIREKLRLAQEAAIKYPEFKANIEALKKVYPKDLTAAEISVRLGSTWIPEDVYNQFIYELLETPAYIRKSVAAKYIKQTGEWKLSNRTLDKGNIKAYSSYGTKRASAYRIIEDTLNLRDTRIFDTQFDDEGKEKSVLNAKETAIAQGKQELIKQAFASWIWKDPQRRRTLCKLYNETFNATRPREYNGQHIAYHGMNPQITMRSHQNDAVAHMLYGNNVLLAHVVGAGKTFEMAAGAMESKYLGLCQKSIFVVPNHLVEQWASEFLLLYPNANLLVTRKEDFQKENRKRFCSKIATGEFDAIIIGQSQFEKIPMSVERQEAMIRRQIASLVLGIEAANKETGQHFSVKAMERSKRSLEDRLKRLSEQSKKDNVINFEQLGVDKMFIDEAHYYKNLFLVTKMRNVAGIGQSEAQKSTDLFMKCQYLDEITDGKGVVFATGTPISNSMVELYTMQRYLQYNRLQDLGLEYFDDWASTFGETVTAMELAPEGTGYRFKTRFAKFNNLPELMSVFKEVADIKTADVLKLDVPKANYHNVIISPTDFQREYINGLAERAEAIHNRLVDPHEDNMLKVTNEGRKLALDQRLINPKASPGGESKVAACAGNVYKIWAATENSRSAQMIFCDLSTPNGKDFNVYDALKQELVAKGVPEEEIAFIHSAKSDLQKKNLFAKVREGNVRVLIGSTQKMGAGTNVQDRLIALHHLDCPWRPSDLEQREGRIVRQGNANAEVDIYRYVTEATFDSYMWQLVENKQKFIAQVMTSKVPIRSAEDVDETSLSYGEVKALASGNPMIIEKCQLEAEVNKLNLQKASFLNDRYELEDKIAQVYPAEIKKLEERIKKITVDIQCAEEHPTPEEGLSPMILSGKTFLEKTTAGDFLLAACKRISKGTTLPLGTYRGFQLSLSYMDDKFYLDLKNKLTHVVVLGDDSLGNIRRIDNTISNLPNDLQADKEALTELKRQFKTAKEEVKNDFSKEQELMHKTERLAKVNALLTAGQSPDRDSKEMIR